MMRSRWTKRIAGSIFALAMASGCAKQVFLDPADIERVGSNIPARLETHPQDPISPYLKPDSNAAPATVLDTNRKVINMTLQECFLTALKQGNIGSQGGLTNAGFTNDSLGQFSGRTFAGSDSIAAIAFDPSITFSDIERSQSKFDARLTSSVTWNKQDAPTAQQFLSFQNQQDSANVSTTLAKPLPTGGVVGITTSMNYSKFSNIPAAQAASFVNPNYTPRVQFQFEQPLLQMFGVQINQLASSHPGSLLINSLRSTGQGTEGILISRIRYDQQRAEFDRLINQMLLNIESAYWDLYAAYYNLFAQEEVLKQSTYLLQIVKQRVEIAKNLRMQQYTQTALQYFQFKQAVLQARQTVLTTEARLRGLMGMVSDDGTRIVPADTPQVSEVVPNTYEAQMDALAFRPEILQARYDLKAQQMNLMLQKNLRRPDLRFFSSYDVAGLGTTLDGSTEQNAFSSLGHNQFNSWQLGLRFDMPIGFRDANALVRQANQQLYKSFFTVYDGERKLKESVNAAVRNIVFNSETAKLAKAGRLEAEKTLNLNNIVLNSGAWDVQFLNQLLIDYQNYARAVTDEYRFIAEYSKAMAGLEWARGTIQRYNNVSIAEGELPDAVKKKAIDHVRAREAALKLREHPAEFALPPLHSFEPIPNPTDMKLPLPPPDTKTAPAPLPGALPVPGGAVPAPTKISQWPTEKSPITPVAAPQTTAPVAPSANFGTSQPAEEATFKLQNTLKFEKGVMSPFPNATPVKGPTGGE